MANRRNTKKRDEGGKASRKFIRLTRSGPEVMRLPLAAVKPPYTTFPLLSRPCLVVAMALVRGISIIKLIQSFSAILSSSRVLLGRPIIQ